MGAGAYHLSDVPTGERLAVACTRCDRRGTYDPARLIAEHGDIPLPHLLTIFGQTCTGRDAWGGCAAVYGRPLGKREPPVVPGKR